MALSVAVGPRDTTSDRSTRLTAVEWNGNDEENSTFILRLSSSIRYGRVLAVNQVVAGSPQGPFDT